MSSQVRVAIIGAAGYTGEELLRLLFRHPHVDLTCITSRAYAGQTVGEVFPRFYESALRFSEPDAEAVAAVADAVFLALPHGLAAEFALPLLQRGKRLFDISADFRLRDAAAFASYYKDEHPAPALLARAVYGSPERYRARIREADLVACPGCYPTSIILAAAPLLAAGMVKTEGIVVCSMSGVSGAGRKAEVPYLFAECNESVRPYGVVGHRHTPEIEQELAAAAGTPLQLNFIPHLVPITRGIISTVVMDAATSAGVADVHRVLSEAYADEPFVRVLPVGQLPDTKHVTGSNVCEMGCASDPRTGKIIVSSTIDNLTKGAAGQAVQCLNIAFGFDETAGLV